MPIGLLGSLLKLDIRVSIYRTSAKGYFAWNSKNNKESAGSWQQPRPDGISMKLL